MFTYPPILHIAMGSLLNESSVAAGETRKKGLEQENRKFTAKDLGVIEQS